jgi:hypothetical protein
MKYLILALLIGIGMMGCTYEKTMPPGDYICFSKDGFDTIIILLILLGAAIVYILGAYHGYQSGKKQKSEE